MTCHLIQRRSDDGIQSSQDGGDVEDHPLDYGSFEGTIAQGQYGGGTVMLWDQGTWEPIGNADRDLARGNLTFILHGKRLKGRWHLVRLRSKRPGDAKRENWLLIKGNDQYADANGKIKGPTTPRRCKIG